MTTKENVKQKTIELIEDFMPHIMSNLDYLLDCGVIDYDKEKDNYKVPKHIVQALLDSVIRVHRNHHATSKDIIQVRELTQALLYKHK